MTQIRVDNVPLTIRVIRYSKRILNIKLVCYKNFAQSRLMRSVLGFCLWIWKSLFFCLHTNFWTNYRYVDSLVHVNFEFTFTRLATLELLFLFWMSLPRFDKQYKQVLKMAGTSVLSMLCTLFHFLKIK